MAGKKTESKMIIRTGAQTKESSAPEFEVIDELFVLGKRGNGVVRLDYGSWNGNEPKYEIRLWKEKSGVVQATKGIGLTGEELIALRDALNEMEAE